MANPTQEQNLPTANDQTPVQDLVIADIEARKAIGIAKYGTLLQPFNARRPLVDAYQESLDQTIYLRQKLEEESQLADALERVLRVAEDLIARDVDAQVVDQGWEVLRAYRAGNPVRARA